MLFEEGFTQNREISWLRYNERILDEALDDSVPALERLRFISIFVSNLEEFFKVRVGSLLGEEDEGDENIDEKSGMTVSQQLGRIYDLVPGLLVKKDMACSVVESRLASAGVVRCEPWQLDDEDLSYCFDFFNNEIRDSLTTKILDIGDPLPVMDEDKPYMIAVLDAELEDKLGFIDIPADLPKIFRLEGPDAHSGHYDAVETDDALRHSGTAAVKGDGTSEGSDAFRYVLTEDIIKMFSDTLFVPFVPTEVYVIDIARNSEAGGGTDKANTAAEMKNVLRKRKTTPADKLICDGRPGEKLCDYFMRNLDLDSRQIFTTTRIDFSYLDELEDILPAALKEKLTYAPHIPYDQTADITGPEGRECTIMDAVKRKDLLSAYPHDSMDLFLGLLREASFSPDVKEIRITIYRLASNPKIVDYLIYAARNGKKVRVVLELRARSDEEKNLAWAERLAAAGCKVYYGTDKYKVHCKMCQIVLRSCHPEANAASSCHPEASVAKPKDLKKTYITQFSTGNYNEKTAKQYTDLSLITYDQEIGRAASRLFKDICKERIGGKEERPHSPLLVSPSDMRSCILKLIKRETKKGEYGFIFLKINALTDDDVIEALMEASCAGCKVRMIVRGICCILPGIEGCTENVCIVNLVGRFLEHSRVYIFGQGDDELMYISSADLMTRNLDRRAELACPVCDSKIKDRIRGLMQQVYCDMDKGRVMLPDGTYSRKS